MEVAFVNFFRPGGPFIRAIVLADVTMKVKTASQKSHIPCDSEMARSCSFFICVSLIKVVLKIQWRKFCKQICFLEVMLKKNK